MHIVEEYLEKQVKLILRDCISPDFYSFQKTVDGSISVVHDCRYWKNIFLVPLHVCVCECVHAYAYIRQVRI